MGTHGLRAGSDRTLWQRLAQHRGTVGGSRPGSGNHRTSIFRLHVGEALIRRDGWSAEVASSWAAKKPREGGRVLEYPLEREVSRYIGAMPFIWVEVPDDPGPESERGIIERNSIALLSNLGREPVDSPSATWLGNWAGRDVVRGSGLWNVNHVDDSPDPLFLDLLERRAVGSTTSA
ncbi:MAG: hypothetical protein U5R31_00520 [Acidimicrobiia bacterium]|nr:hypothetical protein [Acidimicrobiia bacterium]